jgi:small-conductance mechanosensitive channel
MRDHGRGFGIRTFLGLLALLGWLLVAPPAATQEPPRDIAAVELDGEVLFRVRGVEALPAAERASRIAANILALAVDRSFSPESLRAEARGEHLTAILAGPVAVMHVSDADASIEGVQHPLLAIVYIDRIRRAITEYRDSRTRDRVVSSVARAAAAVAIAAVLVALVLWLLREGEARLQRTFDRRVGALATESRRLLRIERLRQTLGGAIGVVRMAALLLVALFLLEYVLAQFPWTRSSGLRLFAAVAEPLSGIAQGFVEAIPNLILLAILFLIVRYGLALVRLYFEAVQDGSIRVRGFEPEWAQPTYNVVRVAAIALAIVIAYPLIPGSDSDAFKGLSILAGVMLSLASTSAIANVVAGYMILYRRAFRVGDRVKIGNVVGIVTEVRLQVTHVRTVKNEEITIPNSSILASEVTNYSKPAREGRLILHTEVGIGYEVPWRQVEVMLIEAARRTPGVLGAPPPFVLQRALGDFAVTYQINAYSDRAEGMQDVYANLHRNILDEFNEHGVQIMTPAYEGDPDTPKVVPKDRWFATPARKEEK